MPKATDARSTGAPFMSSAERASPPALPSPHRRGLLAGAAAVLAATPFAAHAAQLRTVGALARDAGTDAELVRLGAEFQGIENRIYAVEAPFYDVLQSPPEDVVAKLKTLHQQKHTIADRITTLRAVTPAGLHAKARALLGYVEWEFDGRKPAVDDRHNMLAWSIARDLVGEDVAVAPELRAGEIMA